MEVLPLDGAKALKGTGKKREKWPLVDVVSEFILFEPIEKKHQKSIEKHTEKLLIILKISVYFLKLARYNIIIEQMFA
jgi:hypothetical protein